MNYNIILNTDNDTIIVQNYNNNMDCIKTYFSHRIPIMGRAL